MQQGTLVLRDVYTYEGQIIGNIAHGKGTFTYSNGSSYEGECVLGKPDGFGKFIYSNGDSYVGFVSMGKQHGIGTYYTSNCVSKGMWRFGHKHGFFVKTSGRQTYNQTYVRDRLVNEILTQYKPVEFLETKRNNPKYNKKREYMSFRGNEKKCFGCHEHSADSAVVDCGHVCMCSDCLSKCSRCPICRIEISKKIRLYIS
jgi:hypothetical protein